MRHTFTKFFILCCIIATCFCSADADPLSPDQALERFSQSQNARRLKAKGSYRLYHVEKQNSTPTVYLFCNPRNNGFVLLSADDSSIPLLGYSNESTLPADESMLPPAFKYWMGSLAKQVEYNSTNNRVSASQKIVGSPISPLTATRWNQDLPFNYYCPVAGDKHCYTGCVATALAQIMKYHNYPPQGSGSHSYGWKNPVSEKDTTLSFDFASTTFKWDLMQDRYDHDTPWDDKMAVAELMYACGVAVDMGYGPWSSGAGTNMIGPAMVNYFGYDKGIRNYIRDYYGLDDWNELVYNQLKDYGPVQYSGFGDTDGHSFIIDGYDEEGYFHVNWGWGGLSDGYFLLTALDPLEQGIGGAEQAFDFSQDFVGNVSTGNKSTSVYEQILMDNAFGLEQTSAKPGDSLHIWGGSFNYSVAPISNIMFGAMLVPAVGNDTLYLTGPEYPNLDIGSGVRPYDVKLPDVVPAGNYSFVPAFRNSAGKWQKIPVKIGYNNHYDAVSDGDVIKFSAGGQASIAASDVDAPSEIALKKSFEVTAKLSNSSHDEFFGSICVALFSKDDPATMMVKSDAVPVDVLAGQSQDFEYQALFDPADDSLKNGKYDLYICHVLNGKYTKISPAITVDLTDDVETGIEAAYDISKEPTTIYYTLLGNRIMDVSSAHGVVIKVTSTPAGPHASRIIIP